MEWVLQQRAVTKDAARALGVLALLSCPPTPSPHLLGEPAHFLLSLWVGAGLMALCVGSILWLAGAGVHRWEGRAAPESSPGHTRKWRREGTFAGACGGVGGHSRRMRPPRAQACGQGGSDDSGRPWLVAEGPGEPALAGRAACRRP